MHPIKRSLMIFHFYLTLNIEVITNVKERIKIDKTITKLKYIMYE